MGLPLFVEPVESDLPNKPSSKNRATSSPRSNSRLPTRSEIRDRRTAVRRAGVRIYHPAQRPLPGNARENLIPRDGSPSFGAQDAIDPVTAERHSGVFREILREFTDNDRSRRERLEERMTSLLNDSSWRDPNSGAPPPENENMFEGVDLGWWSADGTRVPNAIPSRLVSQALAAASQPLMTRHSEGQFPPPRRRTRPYRIRDPASTRATGWTPYEPRLVRSLNARQLMPSRRAALGLDGLGDRERSLSPEPWDTLLSTLTPDPQPPSAGSSFTSVAASQTPGPSSGTPISAPDVADALPVDPPCESGYENSDMEMDEPEYERAVARIRQGRSDATAAVATVAAARLAATNQYALFRWNHGRPTRQINTPNGPLTIYESTGRQGQLPGSPRPDRPASHADPVGIYVDLASRASAEEDGGPDRPRQNLEEPTSSTRANPMASEDDWAGMQRIVRSLARREDIPDEWWADAGLSRTLGQEEANAVGSSTFRQNI